MECVVREIWSYYSESENNTTVRARTEEEAWQKANKLGANDVCWDNDDWAPTSVNVVNKSEF